MPFTAIDGHSLFYHEEGVASGGPPLVFIHGWTCDHSAMLPLAERFSADHHWIALDLLGHGRSDKPEAGYAIADQAKGALALIRQWAGAHPVLIGHSMGAQVALEVAAMADFPPKALVLLDPAPILPHDKARAWGKDLRRQLARQDIPAFLAAFARRQFIEPVDPAAVDRLIEVMTATPAHVVRAAWDGVIDWDGASALARLSSPTLVISADKPLNRPQDIARANPRVITAQTAGAGHMQQFEVPDQLEAMIRRFLHLLGH
ncbi:MAG: alpha/beta fold hydrolase [Pseudomonadota bacterium]